MPLPHHVEHYSPSGAIGYYARLSVRLVQFVLSIAVIGLYATDLDRARKHGVAADSKWVYAVVVGTLGAVGACIFVLPKLRFYLLWPIDGVIFVLYIALFALFGKIFIPAHPTPEQHGQWRMKRAVWVDLANAILWFLTAVYGLWVRVSLGRTVRRGKLLRDEGGGHVDQGVGMDDMGRYTGQAKI